MQLMGEKDRKQWRSELVTKRLRIAYHIGFVICVLALVAICVAFGLCQFFRLKFYLKTDVIEPQPAEQHTSFPTFIHIDRVLSHLTLFNSKSYKLSSTASPANYTRQLLTHLEFTDVFWLSAKITGVLGAASCAIAMVLHLVHAFCVCCNSKMSKERLMGFEIAFELIAIAGVLACLSLGEHQIERIHDSVNNPDLLRMLHAANLIASPEPISSDSANSDSDGTTYAAASELDQPFFVSASDPGVSYYLLVAGNFGLLLAFIFTMLFCNRLRHLRNNVDRVDDYSTLKNSY